DVPAKKPVPEKAAQAPAPAEARAEAPRPKGQAPKEQGQSQAARDPIGALIRADDTTASVTPKSDRAVLQAQRALSKLGYGPIKADGLMGSSTRAAIEKFERDRTRPVKGAAAGRTLRELAARAGLSPG
uniref:peptidoglycan-binding domain-containing protein n=1 Tax=Methylobacterium nigriterrae TaxID=3127512 RepID=UPI0030134017